MQPCARSCRGALQAGGRAVAARLLASVAANPTLAQSSAGLPGLPAAVTAQDPAAEARTTQLRADAQAFLAEWTASDAALAAARGAPLVRLLAIAELLYTAATWRQQRDAPSGGEAALTATLAQLDALPMLPKAPLEVDACQGAFRMLPPTLQRLAHVGWPRR